MIAWLPVLIVTVGCAASKSANPLAPTVAGPIPGVAITAPRPIEPNSTKVAVDKQPVTLMLENASTSGPRPLSYVFEVAADVDFANKVFVREGIAPGDGGRTALRLPDPLAAGRTYYWRGRAQDGANVGPFSDRANFEVFVPIVIDQPIPLSPVNNVRVDTLHPTFTFANAHHTGPVGPITYIDRGVGYRLLRQHAGGLDPWRSRLAARPVSCRLKTGSTTTRSSGACGRSIRRPSDHGRRPRYSARLCRRPRHRRLRQPQAASRTTSAPARSVRIGRGRWCLRPPPSSRT